MKIAIFSDNFYPEMSGISDSIIALAKGLAAQGHRITFYVPRYSRRDFAVPKLPFRELDLGENIEIVRLLSLPYKAAPTKQGRLVLPILSSYRHIKKFDPDILYTQDVFGAGLEALFLGLFLAALCLFEPRRIPFVLKSAALFILIRSGFIVLTHLGPSPDKTPLNDGVLFARLLSGNDLFFSGHTGLPFLMALIFWDRKYARAILLVVSFIFAAGVLLGHLHYSIDVFSAFFITYSIFHLAQFFFRKDWALCREA